MLQLKLTYETKPEPKLSDLSALLYDYELLYDFLVLSTMDEYKAYAFPRYFWYRSGRPLIKEEKLQIRSINYGSPLYVILATTSWIAVKIIKPLVQISGEIADWKQERLKAKAETLTAQLKVIEKLADIEYKNLRTKRAEKLLEATEYRAEQERLKLEDSRERRQIDTLRRLGQRLSGNPYQLKDITIHIENEEDNKD